MPGKFCLTSGSDMADPVRFQHFEVPLREDGSLFELGRGAMGITYKAFDTNLRCDVALKVVNAAYLGNEVARQRFLREARTAAAIRHPNVAAVFHLGEEDGNYFYAMELFDWGACRRLWSVPESYRELVGNNSRYQSGMALAVWGCGSGGPPLEFICEKRASRPLHVA